MIKNTDYAYTAGYIDGDGCFYIGKQAIKQRLSPKFPVAIIITSVDKQILLWFEKTYGGSVSSKKNNIEKQKQLHRFTLRKLRSLYFIEKFLPYLVEKQEEAKLFISFAQSDSIKERELFIEQMKTLKKSINLVRKEHKIEFEKEKDSITPSTEDFAYLAGFIDAECSLNINKYKPKDKPNYTYKILLQCNNTKAPVFKWLLQRFGGHIHFIDRQKYNNKNQLCWRLSGRALSKIIDRIYPFLRHKKAVCKELIEFYETTLPNGGARHTETFRSEYAEIIKKRERIVSTVHKLNLKGIQST